MTDPDPAATLDRLGPGAFGRIARIEGAGPVPRRLMELGLVPGTEVRVVRRAPLGDPLEIEVRGVRLALRESEARTIHVERV